MAMKVSSFFVSVSGVPAGWSEVYLDTKAATQLVALSNWDTNVRPARLGMLSNQYALRFIRAVDTGTTRASQIKAYSQAQGIGQIVPAAAGAGDWGPGGSEAMPAMVALIMRMEATAAFRRMFLMRGLPLSLVDASLVFNPNGQAQQALQAFILAMTNATYGLMSQVKGPAQFPSAVAIGISGATLQLDLPSPAAPAGWVVNASFRLSRTFAASSAVNGLWKISQINPGVPDVNHTRVFTYPKRRALFGTPVGGIAYIITPTPVAFSAAIPIRGTKKSTGRPFGQLRGRAPAKKS